MPLDARGQANTIGAEGKMFESGEKMLRIRMDGASVYSLGFMDMPAYALLSKAVFQKCISLHAL